MQHPLLTPVSMTHVLYFCTYLKVPLQHLNDSLLAENNLFDILLPIIISFFTTPSFLAFNWSFFVPAHRGVFGSLAYVPLNIVEVIATKQAVNFPCIPLYTTVGEL